MMAHRFEEALQDAETALEVGDASSKLLMRAARAALGCGRSASALKHAAAAVALEAEPVSRVVRSLEEAARSAETADGLLLSVDDADAVLQLSVPLRPRSMPQASALRALDLYDAAAAGCDVDVGALLRLRAAQAASAAGLHSTAIARASTVSSGPLQLVSKLLTAHALLANGKFDLAGAAFRELLRGDPDNGQLVAAVKLSRSLQEAKKEGNAAFTAKDLDAAKAAYGRATELLPVAPLLSNMAAAYMAGGEWEEALQACDDAIQWAPGFAKVHVRRAKCLARLARNSDSLAAWKTALALAPSVTSADAVFRGSAELAKESGEPLEPAVVSMTSAKDFATLLAQTGASDQLLIVDAYATWCGPCKQIAPVLNQLSIAYSTVRFAKFNAEELPLLARSLSVQSYPNFFFFRGGQARPIEIIMGADVRGIQSTILSHGARSELAVLRDLLAADAEPVEVAVEVDVD
eukprot:PLAT4485.1.p1 GENE.PLAT4485.1~~PLAT4485.1.p1  ORF type:complete len:522 (-),score=218.70 PLAT4485.1:153-1547(-)